VPGETLWDRAGDVRIGYFDLLKVETWLEGEILYVVFHLRELPEELTLHRDTIAGDLEYNWSAEVDTDHDDQTGFDDSITNNVWRQRPHHNGVEYLLAISRLNEDDIERTGTLSDILVNSGFLYGYAGNGQMRSITSLEVVTDLDAGTIKMSGRIPGITSESLISIYTNQGYLMSQPLDSICD